MMTLAVIAGCATELNGPQKAELQWYRNKGMAIEEKDASTAAWLGILPGGGSFYTRNYGIGVVNLLCWPFSVLWDPASGYNGAEMLNYTSTVSVVEKKRNAELRDLDAKLGAGVITKEEYFKQKAACEKRYTPDL
ncbi:hypothetical protein KP005_13560 [Geomonas nitrogeniifigens]|uniref:SHOCT domain-containing protein n=2 Tax=Geomonas diazotrophica TaxID=2843197 RepID=A0ABX8JDE0_9BACT|nr:hypothetical protein [Geomonas nitrogeniifigens]QWV96395.1 hypothetical protein KP005_13560 [Geomonas nitrogeniifigens]